MRIIICNLQMFSNDQMIYVFDTETKQNIFAQKTDLNNIPETICALANKYNTTEVKLHGDTSFNTLWADEIKANYSLKYNYNNLNVEVV